MSDEQRLAEIRSDIGTELAVSPDVMFLVDHIDALTADLQRAMELLAAALPKIDALTAERDALRARYEGEIECDGGPYCSAIEHTVGCPKRESSPSPVEDGES